MSVIDVVTGDITSVRADVIVNAANSTLLGGGGVDGAIHRAGGREILDACKLLRATTLPNGLDTGAAVATPAGRLPARWVVHTVGPRYSAREDRSPILRAAYERSLLLAHSLGASSIAFPLISGGAYGWPVELAVAEQVRAVTSAPVSVDLVTLVAYSIEVHRMTTRVVG
ncbi:O-acetyl-ADP-ribose deacetylase [Rhodococcus sp. BP-349]|uniref:O-acetyl-ADP-ribose deacetylase n=1 Tax=unclassified Rhodococcus (in: high G+C Gram-positive bacteria) TaxID=192944 RepID=UPI001C9B73D5|nr:MULTISPECIES: O-acetyl-ADP-ribose deacetylase [unclassified Rhodococcus (in: high G+C Gram-positive bacteria)]MBY6540139.1 O-acetyl-ADP-ribose deacetylase [Rhodococcus sp. BP-363]MBY6543533.1 O-acetyl-ADP-ribose deacetylase [Rhodococcus sp. BP-369]MBY6562763.1 O-acetyl-ADP-ribose deacetylase [Rhodococcus sp. BP-370]MBY6577055.1 O-acetyl-ADP-ribose deacetylase [Rhodococcus sp. BP-364]MBY6586356.1 O-acetyl-ADP-ribose deacetylase [Rhodococcus sp. BP-358]